MGKMCNTSVPGGPKSCTSKQPAGIGRMRAFGSGFPIPAPARFRSALGTLQSREFHDLRAMNKTKNEGTQVAILHRGIRIPICPAWFSSPRGKRMSEHRRRERTRTRRSNHGIARAIENLRRVRLSLVPCPVPRMCLLQGL